MAGAAGLVPGCDCGSGGGGGTSGGTVAMFSGVGSETLLDSVMMSKGMSGEEGTSDKGERSAIDGSGNDVWLRSRRSEASGLGRLFLLLAELGGI